MRRATTSRPTSTSRLLGRRRPRWMGRCVVLLGLLSALLLASCDDGERQSDGPNDTNDTTAADQRDATAADQSDAAADTALGDQSDTSPVDTAEPDTGAPPMWTCERHRAWQEPPACGSGDYAWRSMIPGPGESEFNAALATKAERFERTYHLLTAWGTDMHIEARVPDTANRDLVRSFIEDDGNWDFEGTTGLAVTDVIARWDKVAGAYAGVAIAADAYRYGTLRDQAADCAEIERARDHVLADLEALHLVTTIPGVPGVIARGVGRTDLPGHPAEVETVPLFDADGNPLPIEKNNGTWREDQSGDYPNWVWEDSCSRDQYAGWALGYGALWEVIRDDPTIDQALKDRLQADALDLVQSLMRVNEDGYDLEIHDADGRVTLHGRMHENAIEQSYLEFLDNGFHALLSLGIVSSLAFVAENPEVDAWIHGHLIAERRLHEIAYESNYLADFESRANFSTYNMAFAGAWMAQRYLCDDNQGGRETVRAAVEETIYDHPDHIRQPVDQGHALYDVVHLATATGASAARPGDGPVDEPIRERVVETLSAYHDPPFFQQPRVNCDETEIAAGSCLAIDGTTTIELLGYEGRKDELVAVDPVPLSVRPMTNYEWRSDPYRVNGAGPNGERLIPGSAFRIVYWMGRWLRR